MISKEIRRGFLNYFKMHSHTIVPSSLVVPEDDPNLLFTNAGMNQFKDVFLGKSKRSYNKATSDQKCIRAGGKHNDLENVGFTTRHLTFFEMLGNFSFGDYFKEDAIAFAYDVSTHVFGFEKDKIWATIYKDDDESFAIWEKYLPTNRIVRFGEKENFWAMGDVGPCGPCSELLYDRGKEYGDAISPIYDSASERYLEFWNLVFMQYNRDENGNMISLPKKCIDTGAGLERIVALKMDVDNVFLIDTFRELIDEIENLSKIKYDIKNKDLAAAFHVIADHIRCLAFAIADGIAPSNIDRGYVLRKILRRALRFGKMLNLDKKPFLAKLLPRLSSIMGEDFPEIVQSEKRCAEILTLEEEAYLQNLKRGGNLMSSIISFAKKEKRTISGEEAFKLKDTYGFPIEEILLLAKDENLKVDLKKYNKLEEEAKKRSRQAQEKHFEKFHENFFADFAKTHKPTEYTGHKSFETKSKIIAIIEKNKFTDTLNENSLGMIILNKTPFYAEKGGQVGDRGKIIKGNTIFEVEDTQSPYPGVVIHIGKAINGNFSKQDQVTAIIDFDRRKKIEANHSAAHLLHFALTEILGQNVKQSGSFVDDTRLRFDFDHHKALTDAEIKQIERLINGKIRENCKIKDYQISYEEAKKDKSIKQLFQEKYSDMVRVVDMDFSKELCAGSHASYTGDIGYFRIFKESSIAKGIRRIEAITGSVAEDFVYDTEDLLIKLANILKIKPNQIEEKLKSLIDENKNLNMHLKADKQNILNNLIASLLKEAEKINSFNVILKEIKVDPKDLKFLSEEILKSLKKSSIVVLACKKDNRCQFYITVSQDLVNKNILANDLIKAISPIIKGGGGGSKDKAQAGGLDLSNIQKAFDEIKKILKTK